MAPEIPLSNYITGYCNIEVYNLVF